MKGIVESINEAIDLAIVSNPRKNTFNIVNLTGDEYNVLVQTLKSSTDRAARDLAGKIEDAEEY